MVEGTGHRDPSHGSAAIFILVSFALVLVGPTMATSLADTMNLGAAFEWTWKSLQWPVLFALASLGDRVDLLLRPRRRAGIGLLTPGSIFRDHAVAGCVTRLQVRRGELGELHRNIRAAWRGDDSPSVVLHFRAGDTGRCGDECGNRARITSRQGSRREGRWPKATNPDGRHETLGPAPPSPGRKTAKCERREAALSDGAAR